ncbi:S-adenosyl-L-methionine-dependent methyltransferase [Setomelanomma holmii]|uniref:S-adenosyl-L-methionine-dependent methyltransferase n=1 Tax=Setomelanomma holmii TaxID=210430 RepID=A0A9P4LJ52_9PLEO|nr:S-adenosyl-L-methionine-dependent methyltransferase [Setomelanomma holmii]
MAPMTERELATLNSLADQIKELAAKMTKELEANNIPPVTLEADSPIKYSSLPGDLFMTRQLLEDALKDMWILSQGPSESFDFWIAVPDDGEASFEQIAEKVQLPVEVVTRVLEHAVMMRFFTKPSPSATLVRHTSRSTALAKNSGLVSLVQVVLDETGPPMFILPEALRPYSQGKPEITKNMKKTAFKLCHSGGVWGDYTNSRDFIENDGVAKGEPGYENKSKGWRQRNFVNFMAYIKDMFGTEEIVHNAVDWAGAGYVTVVDLGGSAGHDDAVLARKFPNLKIVVQDLPEVTPVFEKEFPQDLRDRVSFKTHNLFHPQPVQADIYMLRWILHDWPHEESVAFLRAIVPALKPGARVVFIDYVGKQGPSEVDLPRSIQGYGTATDLRMMALFNAKERPVDAWKEIFKEADERFDVSEVKADPLSFMCVLEAVWRG